MKYCGGTFSGHKLILCGPEITVIGHRCTYDGRIPNNSRVAVIRNWGPCNNVSEVRAFLGTVGVLQVFIRNFAHRAHHLVHLTRKGIPFEWGPKQETAQEDLKQAVLDSPALKPLNYKSDAPVILAVDTSYIAVGFYICQANIKDPKKRYYSRFGSITLNNREQRFLQPKLEIYGLFRSLRAMRMYLLGVQNLVVEVDARYIKGMLQNPDIVPSASINRWILAILTFHFTLVHVPGTLHGPDGLSQRPRQPNDPPDSDDNKEDQFDDWIDRVYGFMHFVNPIPSIQPPSIVSTFATSISNEDANSLDLPPLDYPMVPRTDKFNAFDDQLRLVYSWLASLRRPDNFSDERYAAFI